MALGVVELFSEHVAEPDPDLLQLVTALGSQIGIFIERRRVEQELERAKENAEAATPPRIVFSLPSVTNCARRSIRFCSGRTEY